MQPGCCGLDRLRRFEHLAGRAARFADCLGDLVEHCDHSRGAMRGARHVVRDFVGCAVLLLQRKRHGRRIAVDFTHAFGIAADCVGSNAGRTLHSLDLRGDLLGRLRCLHRQRFYLRCDYSKTAARLAGARRLDHCIERKQVRLTGNVADHTDDFADVLNCAGKTRHMFVGRLRLSDQMRRDFSRLTDLATYLSDRCDQFFGGTRSRGHVPGSLVRSIDGAGGALRCAAGRIRQRHRNRLQRRGALRHRLQHCGSVCAKSTNFRFNRDAAPPLLRQCRTFSLGMDALGNIVVRPDPVLATFDRTVDHQNGPTVRRFHDPVHRLALAYRAENLGTILFGIDIEAAGRYPILDQSEQRAAGFHDVRRQAVHLDVAIIADKNSLVSVEQDDTLGHIVESYGQKRAVSAGAAVTPPKHDHHRGEADDGSHGIYQPALLQDGVQANPPPERADVIPL